MRTTTVHRTIVVLNIDKKVGEVSTRGKVIAKAMDGNTWIATPNPPIAEVLTHISDLDQATTLAKNKAPGAVSARKAKERVVLHDLEAWKHQVQVAADADPEHAKTIVESLGFNIKALNIHDKVPLQLKLGTQPGTVTIVGKAGPKGKRLFNEFQYSLDGGKTWLAGGFSTDVSAELANLPSLAQVTVRYRINHKNIPGEWSQPVTILTH